MKTPSADTLLTELQQSLRESQNQRDARVQHLWTLLDRKQTGELDFEALKGSLDRIHLPLHGAEGNLAKFFNALDAKDDGKIRYGEFRKLVEHAELLLLTLFRSIDRNQNGRLEKDVLRDDAFKQAGLAALPSKLEAYFRDIDSNHDGFTSFDQWRNFLLVTNDGSPLRAVLSHYSTIVTVTMEGDSVVEDKHQSSGYFAAGAVAGGVSRTVTAPLDRLKIHLLTNTSRPTVSPTAAASAMKNGRALTVFCRTMAPLRDAAREIFAINGFRGFFAGNGLNVIKIMPETAIKFGSFEAAKAALARFEGHGDKNQIKPYSKFVAGGVAGMWAQFCIYPLDTLKYRLQCEAVQGGLTGQALLMSTARKMVAEGGLRCAYRGVAMGLVGMFPYSAIEMGTVDVLKRTYRHYYGTAANPNPVPGNFLTGAMGAASGALGATIVYPINLVRTRLQTQGTLLHAHKYSGMMDAVRRTIHNEGWRGLYKGLTPSLLKVAPALSITWIVYENMKKVMGLN